MSKEKVENKDQKTKEKKTIKSSYSKKKIFRK